SFNLFFFQSSVVPGTLHSFPTRRSSDLVSMVLTAEPRGGTMNFANRSMVCATPPSLWPMTSTRRCCDSSSIRPSLFFIEAIWPRSEEHTSELQSLAYLVCRLLLEKKNIN